MHKFVPFTLIIFLILGSLAIFSAVSASEIVEDSWNTKTPMSQTRANLGVVAVDGKIYAIGGSISAHIHSENIVGTNEWYDPKTDTWTTLASMPTPRANFAIAADQGKIYCIGGETNWNSSCYVTEVYDIATDSWSTNITVVNVVCASGATSQ
jgi:N-acetylneuraminic acid mutarotase